MKKILHFFCLIICLSCSKEDNSSKSETIIKNDASFTLSKNTDRVDWSNIQIGEVLKFDIKIKNFDTDADVIYVLKPITVDATKHQRNKIDYNFQEEVKILNPKKQSSNGKDSIFTKITQDSIILKKANNSFYISILKPGNFTHQYELRKIKNSKSVAVTMQDMLFSAVKINAYTWNKQTQNGSIWQNSKHSRYYEFTIDDGDQTNDTYLTDSELKKHTYSTLYNDQPYNGNIVINQVMTFSDKVDTEKGAQTVPKWVLTELKIIQKRTGELDNIIIYKNLEIIQK